MVKRKSEHVIINVMMVGRISFVLLCVKGMSVTLGKNFNDFCLLIRCAQQVTILYYDNE